MIVRQADGPRAGQKAECARGKPPVADFEAFCDRVGSKAVAQGLTERKLAALLKKDG